MSRTKKPIMPVFYPVADLSTALITEDDCRLLSDENPDTELAVNTSVFVAVYKEGVFIHIPDYDDADMFADNCQYLAQRGYSQQFVDLYSVLRAWGFNYARLDADGLHTDEIKPPTTKKEIESAIKIKNMLAWSRGLHKETDHNRGDFIEAAGYLKKFRDNEIVDADWPEIDALIARSDALRSKPETA